MAKFLQTARSLLASFGPLLAFYGVNYFWGLKPAIAASTAVSLAEISWRLWKKQPVPMLLKYTATITLVFGCVDLYSKEPFLLQYEACVTNVLTGLFFGASLFAKHTVIEEVARQSPDLEGEEITEEYRAFFRFFTVIWVGYFFLKAAAYFWVARNYPLEKAMAIRSAAGTASMFVMIGFSAVAAKPLFLMLRKLGWLPAPMSAGESPASAHSVTRE